MGGREGDDAGWCEMIAAHVRASGVEPCMLATDGDPGCADAAFLRGDELVVRRHGTEVLCLARERLQLAGTHNVQNALAAAALALHAGASPAAVADGLASFRPLEHRAEPCGSACGVAFVNDSKATNTDATEKALAAYAPGTVVVLLGGHDKGTELASLARAVGDAARVAVCYGEAGPRMAAELATACPDLEIVQAPHMAEALEAGAGRAHEGDTVLLSPACSSFDEFSGFEERGRVFKRLVAELVARWEDA
jgi:UDP-N-acetylmuramoylalanine--D-glutamate ligase